ncbi:MAG: hypothetical protein ACRDLL_09190 [Solirubrobacterales bacterium]
MEGIELRRRDGRRSLRAQGCCGNLRLWELEYECAFVDQTLRAGGSIERLADGGVLLIDRRGRCHAVSAAAAKSTAGGGQAALRRRPRRAL